MDCFLIFRSAYKKGKKSYEKHPPGFWSCFGLFKLLGVKRRKGPEAETFAYLVFQYFDE